SKGEAEVIGINVFISRVLSQNVVSIGKFLKAYEEVEQQSDRKSAGGDRVHISTFHSYKGLEIPVVFIADIASTFSSKSRGGDFAADGSGYVGLKYFDFKTKQKRDTISKIALENMIKERETKEEMRLLYVALTRAKQYLYMTAAVSKSWLENFGVVPILGLASRNLDFIASAIDSKCVRVHTVLHSEPEVGLQSKRAVPILCGGSEDDKKVIAAAQSFVYPHRNSTAIAMKYSVSELDKVTEEYVPKVFSERANVGTIYHRVMENISFSATDDVSVFSELARMQAEGILTPQQVGVVKIDDIVRCLNSPLMRLAARSDTKREKSFLMNVPACDVLSDVFTTDSVLIQGVIDLIIQGEQTIIVDFKNSYLSDEMAVERYKKQLYLYKMAVEHDIGAKVDKIVLYSFKSGKTMEI
ncbi:MAG: 3'-5' exonuclease, partial [Clostridia bacterium]